MPHLRRALLLLVVIVTASSPLSAQAPGRWGCRVDSLSGFNCAQYYSGTVTLTAELTGPSVRQSLRIVATVTGGRVACQVTDSENGNASGPGMIAVTHESSGTTGGGYTIDLWCPGSDGERPTRGSSPTIRVYPRRAADYAVLEGRDAHEHPDADEANRLTGTETITWNLRRP